MGPIHRAQCHTAQSAMTFHVTSHDMKQTTVTDLYGMTSLNCVILSQDRRLKIQLILKLQTTIWSTFGQFWLVVTVAIRWNWFSCRRTSEFSSTDDWRAVFLNWSAVAVQSVTIHTNTRLLPKMDLILSKHFLEKLVSCRSRQICELEADTFRLKSSTCHLLVKIRTLDQWTLWICVQRHTSKVHVKLNTKSHAIRCIWCIVVK